MQFKNIVYAKKTTFGYKTLSGVDGATNVIISLQQFEGCLSEIDDLGKQIIQLNNCLEERSRELRTNNVTINRYYDEKIELKRQLEDSNKLMAETQKKYDRIKVICNSFIRQCKERSNQEKGQTPKKQHTGYSLVSSNPKDYQYIHKYTRKKTIIFETIFQTPYSIDYSYEDAYELIDNDLDFGEKEKKLLDYMGAESLCSQNRYEDLYENYPNGEFINKNIFYNQNIRMNGRAGYWELIINHTRPLPSPPSIMRFPKKRIAKEKDNKKDEQQSILTSLQG